MAADPNTTAYVIQCNDSVEAVVLKSEEFAEAEKERLRAEYFARNRWNFENDEKQYRARCFWAVRAVPLLASLAVAA
jgi:hypothetical protein